VTGEGGGSPSSRVTDHGIQDGVNRVTKSLAAESSGQTKVQGEGLSPLSSLRARQRLSAAF